MVLGTFDPTLLQNDAYTLRLSAFDTNGQGTITEQLVSVVGDLKLGNFRLSFTDLAIPVTGIPITVTRTYDTLTTGYQDEFGYGWRLEFRDTDLRVNLPKDKTYELFDIRTVGFKEGTKVFITLPGGVREAFTFKPTLDPISRFLPSIGGADTSFYRAAFVSAKGVTSTLSIPGAEARTSWLIRTDDGTFVSLGGQKYNPADSYFGGVYQLTTKEGVEYLIDGGSGDLLKVTDPNGNTLTYTDSAITSSTGQQVTFERDAQNRIIGVIDPMGNKITYRYDAKGDLVSVTDREENVTRLVYDTQYDDPDYPGANDVGRTKRDHFLREIIDPLGRSGVRNEYDEKGRLKELIDANGNAVDLLYDPSNSIQRVKDALGNTTTYVYDERGNVLTEIDALGGITRRTYDDNNNLLTTKSPDGRTTSFTYDAQNNKLTETDALGNTTYFTYNSRGQRLTSTSPLGSVVTDTYDKRGNRLSFKSATGSIIRSTFNGLGQQINLVGADGSTTWFSYDETGNVIRQTDAEGNEVEYAYDANGHVISETKKVVVNGELETLTTRWTYDLNGKVASATDPLGNVTRYEYNASGQLTAIVDAKNRKTQYRYDAKGQVIETINPNGTSQKQTYDALGRQISITDELGRTTHYVYDALGRLLETILPDDSLADLSDNPRYRTEYTLDGLVKAEIDANDNRTEFVYDQGGRVIRSRNALGHTTTYAYNARSVKTSETDALGRTTRFVYDEAGRQLGTIFANGTRISNTYNIVGLRDSSTDQAGRTSYYNYDSLRRLVETILPDSTPDNLADNPRFKWEYDSLGRMTAKIDPSGLRTSYRYDAAGHLMSIQDGRGEQTFTYDAIGNRVTETDALGRTTRFVYDLMNRPIETQFPDGSRTQIAYDAVGNAILKTDELGQQTQYVFDAQNRLSGVIDALNQQTEYSYDFNSNLARVTDANNHVTSYEFDALNRRTAVILPMGQRSTLRYDAVGNLMTATDFNGTMTRYEYDALNRLAAKRFQDNTSVLYTYTLTGQLHTTKDTNGLTTYSYDAQDRLLLRTDPDSRSIRYTYDIVGNRTTLTTASGTTQYHYDPYHRLTQVTDLNGGRTQYTYNAVNSLIRTILPNGVVESREYDPRNRLTFLEQRNHTDVLTSYRYTLDAVGNRTEILEHNGRQSTYRYDPLSRLVQEVITDPELGNLTQTFTYDPVGNRLSQNSSTEGLTTYRYDDNDRLIQENHSGDITTYTYDNNGNTLTRSSSTEQVAYQWNSENRLVGMTRTDANGTQVVQYRYNSEGIRVASIVDGEETRYLVDTNRPYAEVIEEYRANGDLLANYVYGLGRISQERGDNQVFYLADGLGSVRLLTDLSGQVSDRYTYDAYGSLLGSTGSTVNAYRYTGEQFDPNLQQYYLRARYYDPATGRFTARDPFEGWMSDPLSLAKYPYVHGNPVNSTDPSGLFQTDVLTALIMRSILAVAPGVSYGTAYISAKIALPILVVGAWVAVYALTESFLASDETSRFPGIPIQFYTNADMPFHRRHIKSAQTGNGYTRSWWLAFHADSAETRPNIYTPPLPTVLSMLFPLPPGKKRDRNFLDDVVPLAKKRTSVDNALINRMLGRDQNASIESRDFARDEYPYASTAEGGDAAWRRNQVSVTIVPGEESKSQGRFNIWFTRLSGVVPGAPFLNKFAVLTDPRANINSGLYTRQGERMIFPG
jgi:RHS repeat-associated protein